MQHAAGTSDCRLQRSRLWRLLGLALLIRFLLLPFTLHVDPNFVADIVGFYRYAYRFAFGPMPEWAPLYPPVAQYVGAVYCYLVSDLVPLVSGLFDGATTMEWLTPGTVFRTLFVLKSLYLVFDLGAGLALWRMYAHDSTKARAILVFWLFNPLIIYDAYIHGQMDVMPMLFVVLGLYAAKAKRPHLSALAFGIGGCFKNYPLLFLLPAVLILGRTKREWFNLLLLGTVPYTLSMLPLLSLYNARIERYPTQFFKVSYDLGFGAQVYIFVALYAVLLWYLYHHKARTFDALWRVSFAILLIYYQFSYFDLHYWVWIVPFAAVYWLENRREALPYFLIIGLCLLALTTPTPLARFLAPISPRFFLRLPSLMEALSPYMPMLFFTNVVRSLLAGTCFYLAWKLVWDAPSLRHPAGPVEMSPATRS